MRKLFFLSVPNSGTSKMAENDVLAAAEIKVKAAGAKDYDLYYGEAVHWEKPDEVQQGAVVHVDDDDLAFRAALQLKDWLHHGTYLVVLNEMSLPNVTFRSSVKTKGATIAETANAWKKYAGQLLDEERLFVSAFVFRDTDGEIAVIGNANPDMVLDVNKWQKIAETIVDLFNQKSEIALCRPIFTERADNFQSGAEEIYEEMMNVNFKLMNCSGAAERRNIASRTIACLDKKIRILRDKFPKNVNVWGALNSEWLTFRYSLSLYLDKPL